MNISKILLSKVPVNVSFIGMAACGIGFMVIQLWK